MERLPEGGTPEASCIQVTVEKQPNDVLRYVEGGMRVHAHRCLSEQNRSAQRTEKKLPEGRQVERIKAAQIRMRSLCETCACDAAPSGLAVPARR
jgi:hypothetical protein